MGSLSNNELIFKIFLLITCSTFGWQIFEMYKWKSKHCWHHFLRLIIANCHDLWLIFNCKSQNILKQIELFGPTDLRNLESCLKVMIRDCPVGSQDSFLFGNWKSLFIIFLVNANKHWSHFYKSNNVTGLAVVVQKITSNFRQLSMTCRIKK